MITKKPEQAKVGDHLPEVTFGPVTRTHLALYAGASGDHNSIHIDIDFAKRAGLKDVFAHGMFSMAQVGRVVTNWAKASQIVTIGVRFQALTHIGDVLICSGEVVEKFTEGSDEFLKVNLVAKTKPDVATVVGQAVIRIV
ncbi:MAG: dehydratase [Robiginitomaculum sp.]|nr:MAG: dehydratase [Robiginitomaculum sp.]